MRTARSLLSTLTSTSTLVNLVFLSALAVAAFVVGNDSPAQGAPAGSHATP
jgi:hypothetical protein